MDREATNAERDVWNKVDGIIYHDKPDTVRLSRSEYALWVSYCDKVGISPRLYRDAVVTVNAFELIENTKHWVF